MKKISLVLALLLIFSLLASCNEGDTPPEVTTTAATTIYHEPNAEVQLARMTYAAMHMSYSGDFQPTGAIICNSESPGRHFTENSEFNYTWKTVAAGEKEYLLSYLVCFSETGLDRADYEYLFSYDATNEIFLLDENGNEGKYVLYMLYEEGRLMAEIVIEKLENGHFRIADQVTIDRSKYDEGTMLPEFYNIARRLQDKENDVHETVGFDGERFLVVNPQQTTSN